MSRVLAWSRILAGPLLCFWLPTNALAQEQSRESAALDNTAAAWSFQLAGQAMPDYRQDTLASGEVRPEGNKGYAQFRMVAPVKVAGVSVLPRLTMRYSQNKDGEWGFSPTDLFALILPFDWGTGRAGVSVSWSTHTTTQDCASWLATSSVTTSWDVYRLRASWSRAARPSGTASSSGSVGSWTS